MTTPPADRDPSRSHGGRTGGAHVEGGVHGHARVNQAGRDQFRVEQLHVHLNGPPGLAAGGLAGLLRGRRVWNIPPPVRSFTGREQQLDELRAQLTHQQTAALVPTTALYGMGGVGKTQLALAYARRYEGQYQLGWWIPAETEVAISTALGGLAGELGLSADLPAHELAARLAALLAEEDGWLLVFDNATGPAMLSPYLPGEGGGHVLVTSRNPAWQGVADPLAVDVLPLDEAVALLRRRSGDNEERTAVALAGALGRLPLALEQAGAYTSQYGRTLAEYLELFDQRRAELLASGTPLAYQGTVDATFTLAVDQLREANPAAVQLIQLCALLAADEIPVNLLLSRPELLPTPLAAAAADPLRRGEVAGTLYQAGLLTRDAGDTARLHRLVQAVTLVHLTEPDLGQRVVDAVALLNELFPWEGYQPEQWPVSSQLLAHGQALIDHVQAVELNDPAVASLLTRMGNYFWGRGVDMRRAGELHEQALAIYRRLYQGDHPDVARSMGNLSADLYGLGEYERARELQEQVLAMNRRLYRGDHRDVAASLHNLALTLYGLGEYERARELHEQVLAMNRRLYKGDHREVALILHNLAVVLRALGEYERARELDEEALALYRRLSKGDHPHVAGSLNSLAFDLRALGEYKRAREVQEQTLAMCRRLYEGDHPHVVISLKNLAGDLSVLGEHERAQELREESLAMRERLAEHGRAPHAGRRV